MCVGVVREMLTVREMIACRNYFDTLPPYQIQASFDGFILGSSCAFVDLVPVFAE